MKDGPVPASVQSFAQGRASSPLPNARARHIGLAALLVHPARAGGAETYAREILSCLPKVDTRNHYTVFVAEGSDLQITADNFQVRILPAPVENIYTRVIWEQTRLASCLHKAGCDLVHFLGSTAPWNFRGQGVVTMHDTLRFQQPQLTPWMLGTYYGWIQQRNVRQGLRVIADSHHAASLFRQHLSVSERDIHSVLLGVDREFLEVGRQPKMETDRDPYILWTGRMYRHKNVDVLLDAYERLLSDGLRPPALRIVGATDEDRSVYGPRLEHRGLSSHVRIEPRIPADRWSKEFPRLYRDALLFCFPSHYESFGLPVLEAMASGTAVLASDIPVHRELYSQHARLLPPNDASGWATAIHQLVEDDDARAAMQESGRDFAAGLTWHRCAEQTVAVYESILQQVE